MEDSSFVCFHKFKSFLDELFYLSPTGFIIEELSVMAVTEFPSEDQGFQSIIHFIDHAGRFSAASRMEHIFGYFLEKITFIFRFRNSSTISAHSSGSALAIARISLSVGFNSPDKISLWVPGTISSTISTVFEKFSARMTEIPLIPFSFAIRSHVFSLGFKLSF